MYIHPPLVRTYCYFRLSFLIPAKQLQRKMASSTIQQNHHRICCHITAAPFKWSAAALGTVGAALGVSAGDWRQGGASQFVLWHEWCVSGFKVDFRTYHLYLSHKILIESFCVSLPAIWNQVLLIGFWMIKITSCFNNLIHLDPFALYVS